MAILHKTDIAEIKTGRDPQGNKIYYVECELKNGDRYRYFNDFKANEQSDAMRLCMSIIVRESVDLQHWCYVGSRPYSPAEEKDQLQAELADYLRESEMQQLEMIDVELES